jgi:predicted ATPase
VSIEACAHFVVGIKSVSGDTNKIQFIIMKLTYDFLFFITTTLRENSLLIFSIYLLVVKLYARYFRKKIAIANYFYENEIFFFRDTFLFRFYNEKYK